MLAGLPVIYGIDPFSEETVPSHALGTIGVDGDGRKYRYAKAGVSALVAGDLVQSPAETTGAQSRLVAAAAIGATSITTTDTLSATADQFANGYIIVTGEGGTGTGLMYKIKSHPAVTSAVCTFQLYEPIKVALTSSTQIDIVANPFNGVIDWPASQTGSPVGVAVTAVTAGSYSWIQTGGPASVLTTGTVAVGTMVQAATATAGAVEASTNLLPTVGYALTGVATAECGAIFLTID